MMQSALSSDDISVMLTSSVLTPTAAVTVEVGCCLFGLLESQATQEVHLLFKNNF